MTPADGEKPGGSTAKPAFKPLPMKPPSMSMQRRADGSILIWSNYAPGTAPKSIAHLLANRAAAYPDRPFILQREPNHGPWRGVTYGQAKRASDGVAQWLLDEGLTAKDAVMVLSGSSVEHGLLMLGAYTAAVPIAPISPAYSLISTDHAKLKHCFQLIRPKLVFAQDGKQFAKAIAVLRALDPNLIVVTVDGGQGALALKSLTDVKPTGKIAESLAALTPASVAKYLFTSGSTGQPKAVPQTHGMMAGVIAGQEGLRSEPDDPSVEQQSLEWMPWSHISAGNIGFNMNLWSAATLYLDEGRPIPGMFETTIKNLYEVSPILFGSAPVAFGMLADAMERDPLLRKAFFKNLRYMLYGGATLSGDIYERMQALAIAETGQRIPITTMYGATETQGVTVVHWETERVGLVGLPLPGITLKLVPNGEKLEVRVKGPTVTSGYHGDPVRTAEAFDDEGFYKLGDAARFVDPEDPSKGLVFDGRVTEDFKLDSGTWVSVGTLRPDVVAVCSPYVADVVITGQDMPFAGALVWPTAAGLASLEADGAPGTAQEKLHAILAARLKAFNATAGGSSRRIGRFLVMSEPPSIDAGEITDKGYINQRAVLTRRKPLVDKLYGVGEA